MAAPPVPASSQRFDESFLRKLEALTIVAKKTRDGDGRAERRSRRVGPGIEFADHRDYAPGDDVRALDWNLYARLDRPYVRLREEDEDLTVALFVDGSASMGLGTPPKLELALRIAAALAYIGLASLDRVGVSLIGDGVRETLPPMRGKGSAARVLGLLGQADARGRTNLAAAVRDALASGSAPRRGLAVVISDLYDPAGWRPALDRLRAARHEVVVVQITATDEALSALIDGEAVLEDAETTEICEVELTPATRRAYADRHALLLREVAGTCRERAIPCFQIPSDTPFEDAVLRLLRAGNVLS